MADYVTVEEIKADIPDSPLFDVTDSTYDTVLGNMVTAASRLIDHYVGGWDNFFYPSTDDTTRYFDGSGEELCSETDFGAASGAPPDSTGFPAH